VKTQIPAGPVGADTDGRRATVPSDPSGKPMPERPFWHDALAPYARRRVGRSVLDVATSVVPYLALSALMYLALDVSVLLTLALSIPTAGFLVRTFIVFHEFLHTTIG
jgi:acyl-lipid omega-6 desaturase (Delta-12 desaturase)